MPNPIPAPDRLRQIKTFPSLVKYLRDELEWPIDSDDFDDLTFDYEPEELGLDSKAAAKIKQIKQLRPLADNQPWGIFFINFERTRLPVVALRRILRALVIKKRQSANRPQQAAWQLHDLLFISTYGETDHRDIAFAHFSEDTSATDGSLPTLRVLGWDDEDTVLHLAHAHTTLRDKLRWPEDELDLDAWRSQWSSAFTLRHREVITTSKALAVRMAGLAAAIRKRANRVLSVESDKGPLRKLMSAFKEALIHDLTDDDFADMYAQTITYGLLTARVSRPAGLVADNVADMVPITNPFLKELMETFLNIGGRRNASKRESGIDFDELGVNDVVDTLRAANMEAVLRDFGDKNPQEDPVIHFYEDFLKEYDAKKRMQRGVFYTPRPVVSFIVRSVDELLRTEFGLEDGLADTTTWGEMIERNPDLKLPEIDVTNPKTNKVEKTPIDASKSFVQILDPATGTGTFLVEVIDIIHKTMVAKWRKQGHTEMYDIPQLWNDYVPKHLLPRLHGYELMMAPYAIAHMKIGLKLYATGYRFGSDQRARVYLTNALEPAQDFSGTLAFAIPALAHEAEAVNAVKRHQRFTAVIGNPPYAAHSASENAWIHDLMRSKLPDGASSYFQVGDSPLGERNPKWLNDDYVKFTRLSQSLTLAAGLGVHGFISNHGFLDNATFRGMRYSLMQTYDQIRALDLHGNVKKKEQCPDGSRDDGVFAIQQGVAISLFCRGPSGHDRKVDVRRSDLWGTRQIKYNALTSGTFLSLDWTALQPTSDMYLFSSTNPAIDYYSTGWKLTDVMPLFSVGIVTGRDRLVLASTRKAINDNIAKFTDLSVPDEEIRAQFFGGPRRGQRPKSKALAPGDSTNWHLSAVRRELAGESRLRDSVTVCLYRPFDTKYLWLHDTVIERSRRKVMQHVLDGDNLGLVVSRMTGIAPFRDVFITRRPIEFGVMAMRVSNAAPLFPLYIRPDGSQLSSQCADRANLNDAFISALSDACGLGWTDGAHSNKNGGPVFGAGDVLAYLSAHLHSQGYRTLFEDYLQKDFPRVFTCHNPAFFWKMSLLGSELITLHLLESSALSRPLATYSGPKAARVDKISYSDETVWIDKAKTRGFRGVPEEVWNFHIGGYQVCEKWLKDRQAKGGKNPRSGRILTDEDIDHYQKIVVALSETIRIMAEIDEVIESHGGWPDAFVTKKGDE